jgi:hypothetical protein
MDFVLRPLALAELPAGERIDVDGGCHVLGSAHAWLALWKPAQVKDADKLLTQAQSRGRERGLKLAGACLLTTPGDEAAAAQELSDALYVYGLPPRETDVPDLGMTLDELPAGKPQSGLTVVEAASAELEQALTLHLADAEKLLGPWRQPAELAETLTWHSFATSAGTRGYAGVLPLPPVCRLMALIAPAGDAALDLALLRAAATASQQRGEVRMFAFAASSGLLRFRLEKLGFKEALQMRYFVAE